MNHALTAALVFVVAPVFAQAPGANAPTKPELRAELLKMRDADQAVRQAAIAGAFKDQAINKRMGDVDAADTARMHRIVDQSGWPTITMVGPDGAEAAWLLVQHADQDKPFQERCLALMAPAAAAGEAGKSDLALLTDRVLVGKNLPQRYGTQTREIDGAFVPDKMEDPDHVDSRRAAMGLDTMAQYLVRLAAFYKPAPPKAP